jgi:hypothetical protein
VSDDARFRFAPVLGVRPAGVPFDVLERLGSPGIAEAGRRLSALERAAREAAAAAVAAAPELGRAIERELARARPPPRDPPAPLAGWASARRAAAEAAAALDAAIRDEYRRLHGVVVSEALRELPDLALIQSAEMALLLDRLAGDRPDRHGTYERQADRSLALYLQRVCAKNDTISRFGPMAWGALADGADAPAGVRIRPAPGVVARRAELERWAVHGILAQLNADPDVRLEVAPRLHPHAVIDAETCWRLDEDRAIPLDAADRALVARCDGQTPAARVCLDRAGGAWGLGAEAWAEALGRLAAAGVLRWQLEPRAIDAAPLASLREDVAAWSAGPARARWAPVLADLAARVTAFAADPEPAARRATLAGLTAQLEGLGVEQRASPRTLYGARNPIAESCQQGGEVAIGAAAAAQLAVAAGPWLSLYADAVGLASAHAFRALREVVVAAPRRLGALRYSELQRAARARGTPIDADQWHTRLGAEAFALIKRELRAALADRPEAAEWELTADDCAVLRRRHAFPRGGDLTAASVDLQVAAASPADAEAGRLQWIVAELHWAPVLLQHVLHWSCPAKPALYAAIADAMGRGPVCIGELFSEAPVHVCGEAIMAALPTATYVGAGRPKSGWRTVRPSDAEVVLDDAAHDIRLRDPTTGADLGSLVRTVRLMGGMHPFFPLERAPHSPRLTVGGAVVQRRAWIVDTAELGGRPTGVSAGFVAAIERLRADRGIPRWVFARPAPGVLGGSAHFARDKDQKPVCLDLESVVFLDVLERRLTKLGQLAITEMLPAPDQLPWVTPAGRFTFELRGNLVPAEPAR